jgi:hypothetical protein
MAAPRRRLALFALVLAVLFTGGWAIGTRFPTDGPAEPPAHGVDHTGSGAGAVQ